MTCIAICGDSSSGKSVLAEKLASKLGDTVILETDRYHLWERTNPHWQQTTQLNPFSNNLDLLWNDIQSLKDGKILWRRSYNHDTGTFTELQEIKPDKHIIICGLHTLLRPELYDIKIFLDTEQALKTEWKIARDVAKRGYTLEQVTKQIEKREPDYKKFIEPQRTRADIIINHYKSLILLATDVQIRNVNRLRCFDVYKEILETICKMST